MRRFSPQRPVSQNSLSAARTGRTKGIGGAKLGVAIGAKLPAPLFFRPVSSQNFFSERNSMPAPRKSKLAKALSGNARPDRVVKIPSVGRLNVAPKPPSTISSSGAAEWRALAPDAVWLGTLCQTDLRAFALLCETLGTAAEAQKILRNEGLTIKTDAGGAKSHPALRTMETARTQAARLLAEFGLTPRSRSSIETAPMGSPGRTAALAGLAAGPDKAAGETESETFKRLRAIRAKGTR